MTAHDRTAWDPPAPAGPPPPQDGEADVVVVGAGIVGLSLATMLTERGQDVVVVARHPVGEGVTGRSTAKVTALHQLVYADLVDRHGAAAAATYAAASLSAIDWVRAHGGDAVEPRASATVARDAREEADLRAEAAAAISAGLPVALEGPAAGLPGSTAALRLEGSLAADPVALLRRLAAGLPDPVRTGRVTSVRERPGGARVSGEGWAVRARHVVVATGLPILDRGGYFALAEPKTSHVVALRQDPAAVPPGEELLITAGEPTRSVRWTRDAAGPVLLVGGEGHRTGVGGSTAARSRELEAWARATYDGVGDVVARWSAEDFMSPDRLPFAGPHLRVPSPVSIVTGMSKWGFALGVACAEALTARLSGDGTTDFGALVDPARLPDRRGARTIVRANAEVARHLVGGWASAVLQTDLPPAPGDAAQDDAPGEGRERAGAPAAPAEGQGAVRRCGLSLRATSTVDGTTREVSAVCTHLGGVVGWSDGDATWDCPLHGSRFEPDGAVRHGPAVADLST